jgi:hypothetical protein
MPKEINDEHIRVAAYYIWVTEGFPQGMDEVHWERASAALALLAAESALPDEAAAVQEEAAVTVETAPMPTMAAKLKSEPAPARPAAARTTAKPVA